MLTINRVELETQRLEEVEVSKMEPQEMYAAKIERAKQIITEHNTSPAAEKHTIDMSAFLGQLLSNGGTTDAALRTCSWEQLQRWGLPELTAQQVAKVFRSDMEFEEFEKAAREFVDGVRKDIGEVTDGIGEALTTENLIEAGVPQGIASRIEGFIHGVGGRKKPAAEEKS